MLTIKYPFKVTFPDHIITRIATFCDPPTLTRCLRVSPFFFNEAGKNLYKHVIIEGSGPRSPERVFRGAEIVERDHREQAADGKRSTNFKRQLLRYVQKITIRSHTCPADDSMVPAMRQAVGLMVDLKQTIISPESTRDFTRSLCHKQICAVIAGLKCDSVTIANIRARDPRDLPGGPLNLFRSACPTCHSCHTSHSELLQFRLPRSPYHGRIWSATGPLSTDSRPEDCPDHRRPSQTRDRLDKIHPSTNGSHSEVGTYHRLARTLPDFQHKRSGNIHV